MEERMRDDGRCEAAAAESADGGILAGLVARRRLLVPCLAVGVVGALVVSFLLPARYVATVTILPRQSGASVPFLQNLAMFGLPSSVSAESLEGHFGRIVESDRVLDAIIATRWEDPAGGSPHDLATLLDRHETDASGTSPSSAKLKRYLRTRVISFDRDKLEGFMELRVTVPRHPWLAAALADSLTAQLGRFMLEYRSGKAHEQAQFVEARERETERALAAADDALTRFIQTNQAYAQSAPLAQEYRRLNREVTSLTSVWSDLRGQLELARIESNNRKQPLDILDRARVPSERAWPRHKLSAIIGLLLGMVAWVALVFVTMAIGGFRSLARQADRR